MKKLIFSTLFVISSIFINAQSVGFSYFFPANGYFSMPIAPLRFNLPLSFGDYVRITPGISVNNIGAMGLKDLPGIYNGKRPLIGPFQNINLSLTPGIVIPAKSIEIELMGGVFGFTSFNSRLRKGNFDDMVLAAHNYDLVRSDVQIDPDPFGGGWVFGMQVDFHVKDNIWGYIGGRYYIGGQNIAFNGGYSYLENNVTGTQPVPFSEASLDYRGFELTLGGGLRKK